MAYEVRTIVFTEAEALYALVQGRRAAGQPVAPGEVTAFSTHEVHGTPEAILRVARTGDGAVEEHVFDGEEMREAFIGYCVRRRVPLPMRGEKHVEVSRQGLALVVTFEINDAVAEAAYGIIPLPEAMPAAAEA
jgi:hypothetical protein